MSAKVIVFLRLPTCLPDCECHKPSSPEKTALLVKNLAEYLSEIDEDEFSKVSSVSGSAIYLNPQNH